MTWAKHGEQNEHEANSQENFHGDYDWVVDGIAGISEHERRMASFDETLRKSEGRALQGVAAD